nr:ribonuclease E inhibitor RraB [uncultured Flavobacterium sp.]
MGIFDFLKRKNKPFVSEVAYNSNKSMQAQLSPQTLGQLRKLNVGTESELKLEFFFYTNATEKAGKLATALTSLGYEVNHGASASNNKEYVITGWTTKIHMTDSSVGEWVNQMCDLGFKHDCEFDGWGTTPEQE